MHGVRRELLEQQTEALGLPLHIAWIPQHASNEIYLERMEKALTRLQAQWGIQAVAFGDLFLEDIRKFREAQLQPLDLEPQFPIWGTNTAELAQEFVCLGFKAVVICLDPNQIDPSFLGRELDATFFADLPSSVDPCGENGEFHTFVYDGPDFENPVEFELGEAVNRDSFWFRDLIPAITNPPTSAR